MRKTFSAGLFTFFSALISFFILLYLVTTYKEQIVSFSVAHPFAIPIIIILWRIVATVIPPLPGGVLSLAFIPVLGWFWAYLLGSTGALIGAVIAFHIARRYREPVVRKFVPLQSLRKLEERISNRTELLAFLGIRLTTGSIMDFVSYIAGLSRISFRRFFIVTVIALIPDALWYYFGAVTYGSLSNGANIASAVVLLILLAIIFFFVKRHSQSL